MRAAGRILTLAALLIALGLQWVGLQSIAWTKMLIQNSRQAPFCQAISKTFDGAHPCSLCHFVNHGKNSEKKSDFLQAGAKLDMISLARTSRMIPQFARFDYSRQSFSTLEIDYSPPLPPPRHLPV